MSGGSRASVPTGVDKTIQHIKEIAVNHSYEEIYAMLKECSMDPNETTQKLLFQDTFHEVKRKRDKRKENIREVSDTRWRPTTNGRGVRTGRGNYTPRNTSHDMDTRRNIVGVEKENGISEVGGKGSMSSSSTKSLAAEDKAVIGEQKLIIPLSRLTNEPINAEHQPSEKHSFSISGSIEGISVVTVSGDEPSFDDGKISLSSSHPSSSVTSTVSYSGVYASSSDPILLPSLDGHAPGAVSAIKREIRMPRSVVDATVGRGVSHNTHSEIPSLNKTVVSEKSGTYANGKIQGNFQELEGGQVSDTYQGISPTSSITGTSGSRPSSNYSNRSQNPNSFIKAGPAKEWKPKSATVNPSKTVGDLSTSVVDFHIGETITCSVPLSNPRLPDDGTKIQKKLDDLLISDAKHVIIPDHLIVSESERSGLSFGSFDSNFTLTMRFKNEYETEESPILSSESSEEVEENVEFPTSTIDGSKVAEENNYETDHQISIPGNQSEELNIPSCTSPAAENNQSKIEASSALERQPSVIHTAPVYPTFGLAPPMLGSHFPTFEGADPHAHEAVRAPSFIVPQPFEPSANYYASIYRPTIDGDGRFSPFHSQGTATKYNGTVASLSNQTGQPTQEVLCSTGSTPLVPQAAAVIQTSIAAGQQPVPVFRQPAGVHISHYPPNYVHYSQYFSPFYVPPPAAIHHFLGNAAAFHQQQPAGSLFPLPTANAGANPAKYPISQYKPGTNSGPPGQGAYGLNPVVYSPAAVSCGNSAGNEDLASSQFKENNVFINGQQTEGSAVWMSPAARDISTFQAGSFYNVPPQPQPLAFAPTQAGHGAAAFPGIYHPTQSVAAGSIHPLLQHTQTVSGSGEINGPSVGVYQQPHRASQINWVNNY